MSHFQLKTKISSVLIWVFLVSFILIDILAYMALIIPDRVDFNSLQGLAYTLWFLGKLLAMVSLYFKKGPFTIFFGVALSPIIGYGLFDAVYTAVTQGLTAIGRDYFSIASSLVCIIVMVFIIYSVREKEDGIT